MPVKSLTIDGQLITSQHETTVLDAAREHGIKIPTLCHLDGVSEVGACRAHARTPSDSRPRPGCRY